MTQRELFLQHQGQTSPSPLLIEMERAEGIYIYDTSGKAYIDLVSGVSVSNIGHGHPKVLQAVNEQTRRYMHLMVYGEYVQAPQVKLAQRLCGLLPRQLDNVYFVNSGSEANEGAIKLAKRYTGRYEVVAFRQAYHGSTQGVLSVFGGESLRQAYMPLVPGTRQLDFNATQQLELITERTAAVIVEPIQAEAGIIEPVNDFLPHLRQRCNETGTLLIFDEIQTGMGRTGRLFAFEHYGVVPDILTVAKAFGGGMPLGAFIARQSVMQVLAENPALGHITTFGGHPVSCAASLAALEVLTSGNLLDSVAEKEQLFRHELQHPAIRSIRGKGLFLAVELCAKYPIENYLKSCIKNGLIFDRFLFNDTHFRIAPPLTITPDEIRKTAELLKKSL